MDTYFLTNWRQFWQHFREGLLTLLYPPDRRCPLCRESLPRQGWLCEKCRFELEMWWEEPRCRRCGRLLNPGTEWCPACRQKPPPFAVARAAAPYDGVFRQALHRLKFRGELFLAEPMGKLMGEMAAREPLLQGVELAVPVPLHPRRFRERGFNQSALLAAELARQLGIPCREALRKEKDTPDQVGLSKEERRVNLAGAFAVTQPALIRDKHVLLVDDIFTTGSTAWHCAAALLAGGAARVAVITWAAGAS